MTPNPWVVRVLRTLGGDYSFKYTRVQLIEDAVSSNDEQELQTACKTPCSLDGENKHHLFDILALVCLHFSKTKPSQLLVAK